MVEAHINRTANVLDGGTIRHQEHTLLVQRTEGVLDGLAIGTRTIGGIDRHDIGTRGNAGASVTQRRRDVNALVPILPQADNRNLTATLNGGNVGKALTANGGGAAKLASARHLSHGLGRTKRLAHIRLNAHDELALQGLNQRIDGHKAATFLRTASRGVLSREAPTADTFTSTRQEDAQRHR